MERRGSVARPRATLLLPPPPRRRSHCIILFLSRLTQPSPSNQLDLLDEFLLHT